MTPSLVAAEKLVETGQGIVAGFLVYVGVDLHGGRDVRVAEDHLRVAGVAIGERRL